VAVTSAGPYASLHLAPDRQPHQNPTTLFFTGRMPFLPPNQQCQSTEGNNTKIMNIKSENPIKTEQSKISFNKCKNQLGKWKTNGI